MLAKDLGLKQIIIEGDVQTIMKALSPPPPPPLELHPEGDRGSKTMDTCLLHMEIEPCSQVV